MNIVQKPEWRLEKGKGRRLNIAKIDIGEGWRFTRNGRHYDHWRQPALQAMHRASFVAYARHHIDAARQARQQGRLADAAFSLQIAASFRRTAQAERIMP